MEEAHLQYNHIGGARLHSLLAQWFWWPRMLETCVAYTSNCLACQLERATKGQWWSGTLLPLPAGPRVEWSCDLFVLTIAGVQVWVFIGMCCYCKYLFIRDLPDKSATSTASCL